MQIAAVLVTIGFFGLMCFQILLASGLPYGKAAWGGRHTRLTVGLRIASGFSAVVFILASLFVLERAGMLAVFNNATLVKTVVWVMVAFFGLNTLGNLASRSRTEKLIMTPVSLVLALLCLLISLAGD